MTVTETEVIEALRPVEDPELHRSIVDLGMVRSTAIDGAHVEVGIDLTVAGCPLRNEIQTRVSDAVTALDGVSVVTIEFGVMTDEQRAQVRQLVHGDPAATAGSQAAHGHAAKRHCALADELCQGRVLAMGGGGYNRRNLALAWTSVVTAFLEAS